MKASGMDVLRTDVYPRCFYSHKRTVLSDPRLTQRGFRSLHSKYKKRKREKWEPGNRCGTRLLGCIFFINTGQERQSLRWLPFLFLFSASFRLEVLDNTALPCYSSAYQIGRTFVRRIATREVHRKKPQGLPKEQNSQVFPPGNEDCGWMWLWRSPPSGDAEGATRSQEHESLRQKDRVDRSDIRFRPDVFVPYFRAKP